LGAQSFGQANTYVAFANSSSIYNNPAGLGFYNKNFVAIGVQQVIQIQGLSNIGFWGNYNTKNLTIGYSIDKFGDKLYHETRAGLALAKKIDNVSFGVKVSYLNTGIFELSSKQAILAEFGIMTQLNKKFMIGLHVINVTKAQLYNSQYLPTNINLGLCFKASDKVNITSQVDYTLNKKPEVRLGMSYVFKENFLINTGVDPARKTVHLGLGFDVNKYHFNYAVSTMPGLGLANHFSVLFDLKQKP
jgi:hypothetical protein